jgi:hypothetical protein
MYAKFFSMDMAAPSAESSRGYNASVEIQLSGVVLSLNRCNL